MEFAFAAAIATMVIAAVGALLLAQWKSLVCSRVVFEQTQAALYGEAVHAQRDQPHAIIQQKSHSTRGTAACPGVAPFSLEFKKLDSP